MLIVLWAVWGVMVLPAAAGLLAHVVMFIDSNPPLVRGLKGLTRGDRRSYWATMWR